MGRQADWRESALQTSWKIARASFPLSARRLATTEPTPKNAPCGSPASSRSTRRVPFAGAIADNPLKSVNIPIRASRIFLGPKLPLMATSNGAPMTTPAAYAEIRCPAAGMLIWKSLAMSGRRPIMTNSVVPMPRPPNARGTKYFFNLLIYIRLFHNLHSKDTISPDQT